MGLSKDNTMGEDLTTNCVINTSGRVDINTGENPVEKIVLTSHPPSDQVSTKDILQTNISSEEALKTQRMESRKESIIIERTAGFLVAGRGRRK